MKGKHLNEIRQIISANPKFEKQKPEDDKYLEIAEFFGPTIQGEGINIGKPSIFLRVKGCYLNCSWCDSKSVWHFGNPYSFEEIFELLEQYKFIDLLKKGLSFVLTGGSPVKQQDKFIEFFKQFEERYKFIPYIEVENECVSIPKPEFVKLVKVWNNSPKLENSLNLKSLRYNPKVLKFISNLENSWFKFVIEHSGDWYEIQQDFINKGLIKKEQIILMPCGESQKELEYTRELTARLAIEKNVRFSDRLHVTIWNKKVGV